MKTPTNRIRSVVVPSLLALSLYIPTSWVAPRAEAAAHVALTLKGQWPGYARGIAKDVAVQGKYAYVAADAGGLQVIDISDPANPRRVGGCDSGSAESVAVSGNYAYLADYWQGLLVIDITDPANPQRVGSHFGGFDRTMYDSWAVAVSGSYAYVLGDWGSPFHVLDISDPANPVPRGSLPSFAWGSDVAVAGNYAYVADYGGGLHVIDITDPASPQRVGGIDKPEQPAGTSHIQGQHLVVSGNYAYVAQDWWDPQARMNRGRLEVIVIANQANPRRVGGVQTKGSAGGVVVSGGRAYVADGDAVANFFGIVVFPELAS